MGTNLQRIALQYIKVHYGTLQCITGPGKSVICRIDQCIIVDMGGFGHLRDFCNFWTRELHLNSSYGLGILRQPFRTMSCRKFGSKINVGMSGIFFKFVIFLASKKFLGKIRTPLICRMTPPALYLTCNRQLIMLFNGQSCTL